MLDRSAILSKKDLKREKVSVPEWGGDVFVSEMTGEARDEWELELHEYRKDNSRKLKNPSARLVVATVVDEDGNLLFTRDDVDEVGKLSCEALDRICRVAQALNKIGAVSIEDAEKNSEAAPGGSSISD